MKSRNLKKLPATDLEVIACGLNGYKPKGYPFPLFINDLKDDTIGWSHEDRYRYIVLLDHLFHKGGFIPNDLDYIAEVSGINRARNWRERAEKLRLILIKSEKKVGFLTQKKVLCEVISASNRSKIASSGGNAKAAKEGAVGTPGGLPPSSSSTYTSNESIDSNDDVDLNRGPNGWLLLSAGTEKSTKAKYPNWCLHDIKRAFNELNEGKRVYSPDKAFIAFVKTHTAEKGQNP